MGAPTERTPARRSSLNEIFSTFPVMTEKDAALVLSIHDAFGKNRLPGITHVSRLIDSARAPGFVGVKIHHDSPTRARLFNLATKRVAEALTHFEGEPTNDDVTKIIADVVAGLPKPKS